MLRLRPGGATAGAGAGRRRRRRPAERPGRRRSGPPHGGYAARVLADERAQVAGRLAVRVGRVAERRGGIPGVEDDARPRGGVGRHVATPSPQAAARRWSWRQPSQAATPAPRPRGQLRPVSGQSGRSGLSAAEAGVACGHARAGPRRRRRHPHRGPLRHRVGEPGRGRRRRPRSRRRCARSTTSPSPATATPWWPGPSWAATNASCSPATSTPSRSTDPPNLPTQRDGDELVGPGHGRHEGRRRRPAPARPAGPRAVPRRHLRLLRGRGDRRRVQRAGRTWSATGRSPRRRLRRPARTHQRRGRGRLQGHAARRDRHQGGRRPLRAALERPQRDPRRGAGAAPADGLRAARPSTVDGLDYHEAFNAVGIHGGIAGNVIPDRCVVTVNYRYAPDKSGADAEAHVREVFDGFEVVVADNAAGRPSRAHAARGAGLRRRPRRAGRPQGGLDRRRPVLRAGRRRGRTSAPATRTSRTPTTSALRSSSTSTRSGPCSGGWRDRAAPRIGRRRERRVANRAGR